MWNNIFISSDGKTFDFHFLLICLASGQTAHVDLPLSHRKHAREFSTRFEPHTYASGQFIVDVGVRVSADAEHRLLWFDGEMIDRLTLIYFDAYRREMSRSVLI